MLLAPDRVESWHPDATTIDPWTVLRLARYRRLDAVPPAIRAATDAITARAATLSRPHALLRLVGVASAIADRVTLREGPTFSGRAVARHLAGCARAVAFVLTLGPSLEAEAARLSAEEEPLDAYLLDTAGWAALEAAVRALRCALVAHFAVARVSHRLGPGHRDWPIEEQRALIELFAGHEDVVRLSEHGLLLPFKSISGLFGLPDLPRAAAAS